MRALIEPVLANLRERVFSHYVERYAVDWAARDAAMRNTRLTLVHAVRPIGLTLPPLPAPTAFSRWQVEQGQKILDEAVEIALRATPEGGPAEIESELLFSPVVPTLVDLSKEAQMVVVGSRGRGPLARSLLGSGSSSLIRHAHAIAREEEPLLAGREIVDVHGP